MPLAWEQAATVPADHPCLAGHFPGRPVVPAVVLIELAAAAIGRRLPGHRLAAVTAAKFLRPVAPAAPLRLLLSVDEASGAARFRCLLDADEAATGELRFVPATTP